MPLAIGRRDFIAGVAAAAASRIEAFAQVGRVYRIGILETVPPDLNRPNLAALISGLREHGYIEGQNLRIEYRSADGRAERFPELAAELVRLPVELIVTRGTPAARAAKAATATIPIVMAAIGEPLGVGVVASLAQPGGNVTGLSAFVTELAGKRIELLKDTLPTLARVGFMLNMSNPVSAPQWQASEAVAKSLGVSAELFDVDGEQDIAKAFRIIAEHKLDALSVGIDAVTQSNARIIVDLAAERKLPTAYPAREFVDVGGLLSYGPSYPDLYRRAAGLIDKILKGANPGNLPVEQPTKLELIVNSKTAKGLGLEIPSNLMVRADEVIE